MIYDDLKKQIQERQTQRKPSETPAIKPEETVIVAASEKPKAAPSEAPSEAPIETTSETGVCGIGGCRTVYSDEKLMRRHRKREHGVGVVSFNQPKSGGQILQVHPDENPGRLSKESDWGRRWRR